MKSTTSTSENPIILPTTTHDDNIVPPPVCDVDGDPLKTGEKYIIKRPESGSIYWGKIGSTRCPNTVMQHNSAHDNGTAVKFFLCNGIIDEEVIEGIDINIMFSVEASDPCANETVWKVGKHQHVVTDGTLGSNFFKIQKYGSDIKTEYKLTYLSEDVCTVTMENGNIRLAIHPTGAPPFVFVKAKNA